jgi:hypothetical protein
MSKFLKVVEVFTVLSALFGGYLIGSYGGMKNYFPTRETLIIAVVLVYGLFFLIVEVIAFFKLPEEYRRFKIFSALLIKRFCFNLIVIVIASFLALHDFFPTNILGYMFFVLIVAILVGAFFENFRLLIGK